MAKEAGLPDGIVIQDLWGPDAPAGALEAAAREVWEYWRDVTKRPWAEQKTMWLDEDPGDGLPVRLGAIADGALIGTTSLVVCDLAQRPDLMPWVASVLVQPAWRGRGIGAVLMGAVERAAAARGVDMLYLFTPGAEDFYARLGWTAFDYGYARGEEIVLMHKVLDPA